MKATTFLLWILIGLALWDHGFRDLALVIWVPLPLLQVEYLVSGKAYGDSLLSFWVKEPPSKS